MLFLALRLRSWRRNRPDAVDSDISEKDVPQIRAWQESEVEQLLQELAQTAYQVSIRVSVFKRLEGKGNGSMLAIMRPGELSDGADSPLDEALALKIVEQYNRKLRPFLMKPIGCVIWSPITRLTPSTPVPATIISSPYSRG